MVLYKGENGYLCDGKVKEIGQDAVKIAMYRGYLDAPWANIIHNDQDCTVLIAKNFYN